MLTHTHTYTHSQLRRQRLALGLPTTRSSPLQTHSPGLTVTLTQETYLAVVIEILQSIRASDMSPMLSRLYSAPGGTEALDVLMKYMYVGAHRQTSVLASCAFRASHAPQWHTRDLGLISYL